MSIPYRAEAARKCDELFSRNALLPPNTPEATKAKLTTLESLVRGLIDLRAGIDYWEPVIGLLDTALQDYGAPSSTSTSEGEVVATETATAAPQLTKDMLNPKWQFVSQLSFREEPVFDDEIGAMFESILSDPSFVPLGSHGETLDPRIYFALLEDLYMSKYGPNATHNEYTLLLRRTMGDADICRVINRGFSTYYAFINEIMNSFARDKSWNFQLQLILRSESLYDFIPKLCIIPHSVSSVTLRDVYGDLGDDFDSYERDIMQRFLEVAGDRPLHLAIDDIFACQAFRDARNNIRRGPNANVRPDWFALSRGWPSKGKKKKRYNRRRNTNRQV